MAEILTIGNTCILKSGTSLPDSMVKPSGDIPYVKVAELNWSENTPIITTSDKFVNKESIGERMIFPAGTTLFPKRGGAIGTNKKRMAGLPICADLNIMGVIPQNKISPKYLFYFFESIDMSSLYNGSSVPQINNTDIAPLRISIPTLVEQEQIIHVLDAVSHLIALRKQQLVKLDELVKARFVEMFGDPVQNDKEWPLVSLGDIADIRIGPFGTMLHKEDYIEGGHALVNPSHITNGKISIDSKLTISDEKYNELAPYALQIGDVVLGRRGEMGRCAVVYEDGLLCGTGSMIIRPSRKMQPYFLQNILSNPAFKKIIEDKAVGVTMMNLNIPIVSSLSIPLLPIELQEEFIKFMGKVDESKLTIHQSLDKLEVLKKALMQEYFG